MHVEVCGLNKKFGQFQAIRNIEFTIAKGRLIGLLGPSGCGKTSILRMLAGLEVPDSGHISFHGKPVDYLAPQERGIGFVFQHYALFKHMTVEDNIAFGLHAKRWDKGRIRASVAELVELTGLNGYEERYPHQLSGGQQQRVTFARALAPEPQLLLLDEPFAAIDAKIRQELRAWLRSMIDRLGITSIFVTHDQQEAIEVADEIMIINQGRLEQKGTPWEIYRNPRNFFVASFIGDSMIVENLSTVRGFENVAVEQDDRILIRPEAVEVSHSADPWPPSASASGRVRRLRFLGDRWLVEVDVGPSRYTAYRSLESHLLQPGDIVRVLVRSVYRCNENECGIVENKLLEPSKGTSPRV